MMQNLADTSGNSKTAKQTPASNGKQSNLQSYRNSLAEDATHAPRNTLHNRKAQPMPFKQKQ